MLRDTMDENLIVVAAVEGYARKHNMDEKAVFEMFHELDLLHLLRSQYEVLHTQDLDESVSFVEDVIKRKN